MVRVKSVHYRHDPVPGGQSSSIGFLHRCSQSALGPRSLAVVWPDSAEGHEQHEKTPRTTALAFAISDEFSLDTVVSGVRVVLIYCLSASSMYTSTSFPSNSRMQTSSMSSTGST